MTKFRSAICQLAVALALTSALCVSAFAETPSLDRLKTALGGIEPDSVQATPIPGLYEVVVGSQILYLTEDGNHVIQGTIVDLASATNLTETRTQSLRAETLSSLDPEDMIIFSPEGETKYSVMVFTDIDCGYCRKLHSEMASYNDAGIEIRYLAFPRAGKQSESFDKAVSAWCADDPKDALTKAKQGATIETRECSNPVAAEYDLGQQLGVRGTPSIFFANGEMVPGYVPAERLLKMLNDASATN